MLRGIEFIFLARVRQGVCVFVAPALSRVWHRERLDFVSSTASSGVRMRTGVGALWGGVRRANGVASGVESGVAGGLSSRDCNSKLQDCWDMSESLSASDES